MKSLSYLLTTLFVVAIFSTVTYFSACKPDACITRNVQCQNNGTCREGDCLCSSGYEGDSCQFKVNKKFDSHYACIRTGLTTGGGVDNNDDTVRVKALEDRFAIQFFSIRDSIVKVLRGKVNTQNIVFDRQEIADQFYWGMGSLDREVLTVTVYNTRKDVLSDTGKTTYVGYKFTY